MSRLRIHDLGKSCDNIELEQMRASVALPADEKMRQLFRLISLTRLLNGGKSIKQPQGKRLIFRKIVLLLLLAGFYNNAAAQIKGTFSTKKGFVREIYTFSDSNKFSYNFYSCTGGEIGAGDYKIVGNDIFFKISKEIETLKSYHQVNTISLNNDSLKLDLHVVDINKDGLPVASCKMITDKDTLLTGTDIDGHAEFRIKGRSDSILIFVFLLNTSYSFSLPPYGAYNVSISLLFNFDKAIPIGSEWHKKFYLNKNGLQLYSDSNQRWISFYRKTE